MRGGMVFFFMRLSENSFSSSISGPSLGLLFPEGAMPWCYGGTRLTRAMSSIKNSCVADVLCYSV